MGKKHNPNPHLFLEQYKGKFFNGQWPTLPELFNITTERYPHNNCFEAFVPEHLILDYAQAQEKMRLVANWLYSQGVRKGDRVGLTGKNSPEWALAYMGTLYAGAIIVPVDYTLTDEEIEHLIDFVEIKGLFVDGERFERLGKDGKYQFKVSLESKGHESEYIMNLPDVGKQDIQMPECEDTAAFLFTSGTTGTPKAVMLTHHNLVSDCFAAQGWMNIYPTDVFYAILPIHHAYTMLAVFIESMSVGAKLVFGKRLVTTQMFKEMKEGGVTMLLAVPMLYNKMITAMMKGLKDKSKFFNFIVHVMMRFSGFVKKVFHFNPGKKMFGFLLKRVSLDKNRICISGGGPLPASTFKQFNQLGIDFVQGYGLTETSPIITLNPTFDYEETSIGKVLPFQEIDFVDKDDQGNGEIIVRGENVMKGYYKNPEATAEIITEDGWLHTGDIGYRDKKGFVYLTGRAKNIIVTEGGKNVFPEEIEDHFQLYDEVEQICVLGYTVDATMKSEGVCALVYPSKECQRNIKDKEEIKKRIGDIIESVNKELLPYKRIRKFFVIDEPMEMTSTKKIKRFVVAKKYKEMINEQ